MAMIMGARASASPFSTSATSPFSFYDDYAETDNCDCTVIWTRTVAEAILVGLDSRFTVMNFLYILATVLFTVYGQLIVKWQVVKAGSLPQTMGERIAFLIKLLLNPWILSGVLAGFLALLCWMIAMTRFELSYAYPFMSLAFVFVLILSAIFFHEPLTIPKIVGVSLVMGGILVGSQG